MSKFKGTSGEWEIRLEQISPGSNEECWAVATEDFDVVSPLLGIRCEADAMLIAKSKELLDALDEAASLIGFLAGHLEGRMGDGALGEMYIKARDWAELVADACGEEIDS